MALRDGVQVSPTLFVGPTSSRMVSVDEAFAEVVNVYPTEEGSFRSVSFPLSYVYATSGAVRIDPPDNGVSLLPLAYGPQYGIHHAMVDGRELLLMHNDAGIWELHGWDLGWAEVLPSDTLPDADVINDWPTQWVTTPKGVVMIPQGGRAYFYDGETVAPFGFARPPSAPTGRGPRSTRTEADTAGATAGDGVNDSGYAHHRLKRRPGQMDDIFGFGRIGTVDDLPNVSTDASGDVLAFSSSLNAGMLQPGVWRAKVAWVDPWGNLSALSPESNDVTCDKQPSSGLDDNLGGAIWQSAQSVRFQIAWDGIGDGPEHVVGKNIYRTRDMLNSGDTEFYLLSNDATVSRAGFATLQSRSGRFFPDNIPDAWLSVAAPDIIPVPVHRLGALAFGRYWAANLLGEEGTIRPSLPGLFGTFEANQDIVPDPTGGQITGIHTIDQGLLVFTETSTFLVVPNDRGDGFRVMTVSSTTGCVAPSSIASTRFGWTIWLGRDGFYGFDGDRVAFLFEDHRDLARRFNKGRLGKAHGYFNPRSGQYECWVPFEASENPDYRFKFNGQWWHWDNWDGTVAMLDSTVTADHRGYVLGVGSAPAQTQAEVLDNGCWLMDHGFNPATAKIKTGWLRGPVSQQKTSVDKVRIWMRETSSAELTIKVRRNWRAEVLDTRTITLYPEISDKVAFRPFMTAPLDIEKNPGLWDSTLSEEAIVRRRRPFWGFVTVDLPTCEVFQLEIEATGMVEIIGLSYEFATRDGSGSSNRRA